MTELLDVRPPGIDVLFRRGNPFTLTLNWPAGVLTGRTFTASLDAAALVVSVVGNVMTVSASAAQTTAAADSSAFQLTETTAGTNVIIQGTWGASTRPSAVSSSTVAVTQGAATVNVTGLLAGDTRRQYMDIPTGWGLRWRQALSESSSRLVRIVWIGDSLSVGPFTGQAMTNFSARLRNALTAAGYPDGGSGFIDANSTGLGFFGGPGGLNGPGTESILTGAWSAVNNGVNTWTNFPNVAGSGATITLFPRGSTVDIISRTDPTFGRYDRQIDGGAIVQVPQNVAAAVQTTTITGLSNAYHSVKLIAAAGQCRLHGVRARNATGVMVENFSTGGRSIIGTANALSSVSEGLGSKTSLEATFDAIPTTDLCVFMMGANDGDPATGGTPQTVRDQLASLHRRLRAVGGVNGQPDILVCISHVSGFVDANVPYRYSWIADTIRAWGRAHGAAVIDLWEFGRFSGEYGAAQGWFPFGSGDPHLSDSGYAAMAAPINQLIVQG